MLRILVVEDESIVAADIRYRLETLHYQVVGMAARGEEAVRMALDLKPDLILMDVLLKGEMDGIEASHLITAEMQVPIMFLTASSDEKTVERAKASQPYGYLLKPFEERELHTGIEMAMNRFELERKLKDSEQWLSTILYSWVDGVIATDPAGLVRLLNPAAEAMLGVSEKEVMGHHVCEHYMVKDEDTGVILPCPVDRILKTGCSDAEIYRLQLVSRTGSNLPVDQKVTPIRAVDGRIIGALIVFRNQVENRRAENEIRKLSAVVEQNPSSIMIMDQNGKLEYINPRFCELTGYMPGDVIGRTFYEAVQTDLPAQYWQDVLVRASKGELWSGGFQTIRKDGSRIWESGHVSVIVDVHGRVKHYVMMKEDITDRKKAEDALQKTMLELADLNQNLDLRVREEVDRNREKDRMMIQQSRLAAMGEMIGNIAHQWRQPLNSIGIIIQNIQGAYQYSKLDDEYLKDAVSRSLNILTHMSQTIDDFRNFFKPNKEKEFFSIRQAVEKTLSFLEASFREHNIEIRMDFEDEGEVTGYFNEYCQVVLNILSNSKDVFLDRKIEKPQIRISLSRTDGRTVLKIADNGGGISQDIMEKIFDPYFTTKTQGTGIGLYMSKMIVEKNMGGLLTARNIPQGVEFIVIV